MRGLSKIHRVSSCPRIRTQLSRHCSVQQLSWFQDAVAQGFSNCRERPTESHESNLMGCMIFKIKLEQSRKKEIE